MRGSRFRQTPDRVRRPWLAASNNAPRMSGCAVSNSCQILGADVRPNWREQPQRPSLTGGQWTGQA
jgi:hypothetical protein